MEVLGAGHRIGRNAPCHCGSGKKYKKCCLNKDRELERSLPEALQELREFQRRAHSTRERLREEYGTHVNYVSPALWQSRKVWAIGSRVYPDRPPGETFHEFLIHVLRGTLGEMWRGAQAALPEHQRHIVMKCFDEFDKWRVANADPETLATEGRFAAYPSGWVQSLISLAWDVATLIHASNLPEELVFRLRDPAAYQGARYEVAIAAIFARLDCEIRFLDKSDEFHREKRVEFVATHRETSQAVAVEAKSRHRVGVLNTDGEPDEMDPLRGDARAVRRLFFRALEKAPEDLPFMIFIDINAPGEPDPEKRWMRDVRAWMDRLPAPTPETPDVFNALYVTNFSPHYFGPDIAQGGGWLSARPRHTRTPTGVDLAPMLDHALARYGRVPDIRENGEIG